MDDYSSIFGRVNLDLGQVPSEKTTDKLLKAYNDGSASEQERRYLEVMLFQYGRYLTIESSRETPEDVRPERHFRLTFRESGLERTAQHGILTII